MKIMLRNNGSVIIVVIFAIALLSVVTMGILQMNTEEIQLMQNQIFAAHALATTEAGLNDAFARIRGGSDPNIADEPFNGGTYDVNVTGTLPNLTVTSTGTTSQSFVARVEADITVGTGSPYVIRIDNLRINE
jgi:Tfp pilus assembly protein PilX